MNTTTTQTTVRSTSGNNEIRPFRVSVPEAELTELRRRINATKFPERETVLDASQGVQLATMKALAGYWSKEYNWRKIEAKMNAVPQFITEIDGLDIHFIHVRSNTRARCRSLSHTGGPARSSSRSSSSARSPTPRPSEAARRRPSTS